MATEQENNKEYLDAQHDKFFFSDQFRIIFLNTKKLLLINEKLKSKRIDHYLYYFILSTINRTNSTWINNPYQPVIEDIIKDINKILKSIDDLPDPICIKTLDVRGFDLFNAQGSPFFGENIIQIQSGLLWFSHMIARSLEPLIHQINNKYKCYLLNLYFANKFKKTLVSLIVEDHTLSFSKFHFIPEKESILNGLEVFIIAHEYAHLLISDQGIDSFNFERYYSTNTIEKIKGHEEIAADSIALIILYHSSKMNQEPLMMYSPRLLFQIFLLMEKSKFLPSPSCHPHSIDRHRLITEMSYELDKTLSFNHIDDFITSTYNRKEKSIGKMVSSYKKKERKIINIFTQFQHRMVERGYKELFNIGIINKQL